MDHPLFLRTRVIFNHILSIPYLVRKSAYDTMWYLTVRASFIFVDAMHFGYYRFGITSMMPLVHRFTAITMWVRIKRIGLSMEMSAALLLFVFFGNILGSLCLCVYDFGFFADTHIERVDVCSPGDHFGDEYYHRINDYNPWSDHFDAFESVDDSPFDSWIDVINDETTRITAEYFDLLDFVNVNLKTTDHYDEWTNCDEFGHCF